MNGLGARIKEFRTKNRMTQAALGKAINKSKETICGYETGVQIPPTDVLKSIAEVFHLTLDALVGMEHGITYTTKQLTESQREIVELLFSEFSNPSGEGGELSAQQMTLLNKLFKELQKQDAK